MTLKIIFGASESLFSFDTHQFKDYSKVVSDRFDPEKKAKRRKEVFPNDLRKSLRNGFQVFQEKELDKEMLLTLPISIFHNLFIL